MSHSVVPQLTSKITKISRKSFWANGEGIGGPANGYHCYGMFGHGKCESEKCNKSFNRYDKNISFRVSIDNSYI